MPDLGELFEALEYAAFRREGADRFTSLNPPPAWLHPILVGADQPGAWQLGAQSLFLEHFLAEAEAFWAAPGKRTELPSEVWSEPAIAGGEMQLRVTALSRGGKHFLVIAPAGNAFEEQREVLQKARQGQLEHEALAREIEKKEVLVHCIVHDLANPLSAIIGSLGLVERSPLSEVARKMVQNALLAADRQKAMIREILDVFSAEATALDAISFDPRHAPDLVQAAGEAIEHAAVTYQRRDVSARVITEPADVEALPVVAERTRLDRIFANLLENALRYTPRNSEVTVTLARHEGFAMVRIEDAGTGVPASAVPNLFQKLAPGPSGRRGKAGLGLYFCRITVERWGGAIGYERGARGGACFWFRLKLA